METWNRFNFYAQFHYEKYLENRVLILVLLFKRSSQLTFLVSEIVCPQFYYETNRIEQNVNTRTKRTCLGEGTFVISLQSNLLYWPPTDHLCFPSECVFILRTYLYFCPIN